MLSEAYFLIALVGTLLALTARAEPVRNAYRHNLAVRQIPGIVPANNTGNMTCMPNQDLYECAENIAKRYFLDIGQNRPVYKMKVPLKMYKQKDQLIDGYVEVDAQIDIPSCSSVQAVPTFEYTGTFCGIHACAATFEWITLNRTVKAWGHKVSVGLSVTVKASQGPAALLWGWEVSTTASTSYENTESNEEIKEVTDREAIAYTIANGQICAPTTIQLAASCTIVPRIPVSNLFLWHANDGSSKKLAYCGTPSAPGRINEQFSKFCSEVDQPRNVSLLVETTGGNPWALRGCAFMRGTNRDTIAPPA